MIRVAHNLKIRGAEYCYGSTEVDDNGSKTFFMNTNSLAALHTTTTTTTKR